MRQALVLLGEPLNGVPSVMTLRTMSGKRQPMPRSGGASSGRPGCAPTRPLETYVIGVIAIAAVFGLRVMLELRLRDRHPEIRRTLVVKMHEGNLLVSHMDNTRLLGFLFRRTHRSMNDPRLSLLSDAMLVIVCVFMVIMAGAILGLLGQAFLQYAGR